MTKSKKKLIRLGAAVLALALVVGTFAYYSSVSKIDNNMHTLSYGDRTIEHFTPDQELEPGSQITKEVGVTNTGDYDLVVRIKMEEKWVRGNDTLIDFDSSDDEFNTVDVDNDYTATQGSATDGQLTDDESVMHKQISLTNWFDGGDGYWYYDGKLAPGANTGNLLELLVLAKDTDMGKYNIAEAYSITAKTVIEGKEQAVATAQADYNTTPSAANETALNNAKAALETAYAWTTTKPADTSTITYVKSESALDATNMGYAKADYTLTIITEVCQATKDAIVATWTGVDNDTIDQCLA